MEAAGNLGGSRPGGRIQGLDAWAHRKGVTLDFRRPGKPSDNAMIEAFNARAQAERLNVH